MLVRDPRKILIGRSGGITRCVIGPVVSSGRRLFRILSIYFHLICYYFYFIPTPCSLGCRRMFLGMIPILIWCRPISVPGMGVFLYATGSLLRSWPRSSVSWRLGIFGPLCGCNRCCVWVCGFLCRILCHSSGICVFVLINLWGSSITCMSAWKRRRRLWQVDPWPCSNGSAAYFICTSRAWKVFIYGIWWGGPVICISLIASVRPGIFDLMHIGLGGPKEPLGRMQIHPIWWPCMYFVGVWIYLLWQTVLSALIPRIIKPVLS